MRTRLASVATRRQGRAHLIALVQAQPHYLPPCRPAHSPVSGHLLPLWPYEQPAALKQTKVASALIKHIKPHPVCQSRRR